MQARRSVSQAKRARRRISTDFLSPGIRFILIGLVSAVSVLKAE